MNRAFSAPPIIRIPPGKLVPYRLEGYTAENRCEWLPVSFDPGTQCGSYFFRLLPGAVTIPHVHPGYEEFYVLEGEAVESDGSVIKAGDFICFPPNSYHFTSSEAGCLVLVFEWHPRDTDKLSQA